MIWDHVRLSGSGTNFDMYIRGETVPTQRYIITAIDGLGPPEAVVSMLDTLYQGPIFQSWRPQAREIVIRLGLNPNYQSGETPSELREALYAVYTSTFGRLDPNSMAFSIRYEATTLCKAMGYVKKFEIVPFSKDPEVQITIQCRQPYFEGPGTVEISGDLTDKITPTVNNSGTAPTGFLLEVTFTDDLTGWKIRNSGDEQIEIVYDFEADDILTIDTRPGSRAIYMVRGSDDPVNLLDYTTDISEWMQLRPGDNYWQTSADDFDWNEFRYLPQFVGV